MTGPEVPSSGPNSVLSTPTAGEAVAVVVLHGELDLATLPGAQTRVEDAERGAPALLVIDLSELAFVDSSGVRLVLLAADRARTANRRLAVKLGGGTARRIFQTLGLTDQLDLVDDERLGGAAHDGAT